MSRKKIIILFTLVFLIFGAFLRIYPLSSQPYWMDEGYTITAVTAYNENKQSAFSAVLDSGEVYECFLYCKPTSIITSTFEESPFTYRIVAVFFGILSLFVLFLFTKIVTNKNSTALLTILLLNFSYLHIAWSTQARWYTMALTFTWIAAFFYLRLLYEVSNKKKAILLCLLTVSILTAVFTHKILLGIPLLLICHYFFIKIHQNVPKKQLIAIGGSIFVTTLLGIFILAIHFDLLNLLTIHYNLPYYANFLWQQYWLLIPFAIFALTSMPLHSPRWFVAWIFIGYSIPLIIFTDIVQYRYLFMVTPALFILAAIGIIDATSFITQKITHKYSIILSLLLTSLYFISPTGSILPQERYWLESDTKNHLTERPSLIYTPQPNWNEAYAYIKSHKTVNDSIVSSHPHFTKIFLDEAGYWISYNYLDHDSKTLFRTPDGREYYVGAKVIDTLSEFILHTNSTHGFIVFDYMAIDGRIPTEIINYIRDHFVLVYHSKDNDYSELWVYQY